MSDNYEIAQALRKSHCDRSDSPHECVGEITIKRGEVCLNCQLCGSGEEIPGWNHLAEKQLREVFRAAGINWENLQLDARVDAMKALARMRNQ